MTAKKRSGLNPSAGAEAAKQKSAKKRELTPKQSRLLEGIAKGKSTRRAALDAGYSARTAAHPKKLLSTQSMRDELGKRLASPGEIADVINAGMRASDTYTVVTGRKGEEQLIERERINWMERRKAAELAARFKGLDPGIKIEHEGEIDHHLVVEHIHLGRR